MEITVKMPICLAPRIIDIAVSVGDTVRVGDVLFSYESDGALMFEYSAYSGTVTEMIARPDGTVRIGDVVLVIDGNNPREFTL